MFFFFSFFLPPTIYVFFEREIKKEVCESGDEKELEKNREYFFSVLFSYDKLRIYTHRLQYQSISALIVINNIRKELVMITAYFGNQIAANQSTKSIKINNIDSKCEQIREQNHS